jgi:DNA-binding MarR family transcriptional regulator
MTGFELAKAALHAPSLSTSERLIFALVCDSCDGKGVAYLCKQEEIADRAASSVRTVRTALAELEARGWIRRTRRHRQSGERGVDVITVTPNGRTKDNKLPAFKLPLVKAEKPAPVVEPRQRTMPLAAVVAGKDREGDNRQPLPLVQPATIAASEPANRQGLPLVQPATIAGQLQTSFSDKDNKTGPSGRPPHGSGGPPAPPETQAEMAKRLLAAAEANGHGPVPERLRRKAG